MIVTLSECTHCVPFYMLLCVSSLCEEAVVHSVQGAKRSDGNDQGFTTSSSSSMADAKKKGVGRRARGSWGWMETCGLAFAAFAIEI